MHSAGLLFADAPDVEPVSVGLVTGTAMFVTTPELEHPLPLGFQRQSAKYWHSIFLSETAPFFIVTLRPSQEPLAIDRTAIVAWESTLCEMLTDSDAGFEVRGITRVDLEGSTWQSTEITEVWLAGKDEAIYTGPLLFAVRDRTGLVDCFRSDVRTSSATRRLIFDRMRIDVETAY